MITKFLFTVDVETRSQGEPNQDIMGIIPGYTEKYGIERMMDMLEAQQVRGTFFLNVYETAKYGEDTIAYAAQQIHSRGHDVELHTHPRPMFRFYGMSQAPFEQQSAILKRGISLLVGWIGKKVIAHRAGAFSANVDTLRAVESVRLLADCSLSPGSRVSVKLVNEIGATNLVRRVGKIWEIPVTYYSQLRVGPWQSRRILDIEGSSLPEIKRVTRWAIQQGLPTVCILMHSFSLCRHGRPNWCVIRRFSALIAWLREQDGIEINTIEHVCQHLEVESILKLTSQEPNTGILLMWNRALLSWNDGWRNLLVAIAGLACLAILMLVLVYLGHTLLKR